MFIAQTFQNLPHSVGHHWTSVSGENPKTCYIKLYMWLDLGFDMFWLIPIPHPSPIHPPSQVRLRPAAALLGARAAGAQRRFCGAVRGGWPGTVRCGGGAGGEFTWEKLRICGDLICFIDLIRFHLFSMDWRCRIWKFHQKNMGFKQWKWGLENSQRVQCVYLWNEDRTRVRFSQRDFSSKEDLSRKHMGQKEFTSK